MKPLKNRRKRNLVPSFAPLEARSLLTGLTATSLGQLDQHVADLSRTTPDANQDLDVQIQGIPAGQSINHVDITWTDPLTHLTTRWQSDYPTASGPGHDAGTLPAVVQQAPGASSADVFFEPDRNYTAASFEVNVYLGNSAIATTIPVTVTADANLPMFAATYQGQDNSDEVGLSSPAPDGLQDLHFHLTGITDYLTINHIDVRTMSGPSHLWRYDLTDPNASPAVFVQGTDPTTGDLYVQPPTDYNNVPLEVDVYYGDRAIAVSSTANVSAIGGLFDTAPPIVDDSQGAAGGYTTQGAWSNRQGSGLGFDGTFQFAFARGANSAPTSTATWQATNLAPGSYDVQATWYSLPSYATNAPYSIYDGNTLLATVNVNQTKAPQGVAAGGSIFQSLGMYPIKSGTLRVVIGNNADGGYVVADAIRVATPAATPAAPALVDDGAGLAGGFTLSGAWRNDPGPGYGVNNEFKYTFATPATSAPTATATWRVAAVTPGTYDIEATWYSLPSYATAAPYSIYDGNTLLATVLVDQTRAPQGPSADGVTFQSLGLFNIRSGTLRVVLSNNTGGRYVVADAIRMLVPSVAPGQPATVDDGQGAAGGFTTAGLPNSWSVNAPSNGVVGNEYESAPTTAGPTPTATATWQLADLASGYYDVQASWNASSNGATNAPFQVYDGNTLLATVNVDETKQPGGPTAGGVAYQSLGMFAIRSGTLRVVLGNNAAGKYVAADSVRVAVPSVAPGQPATVDDGQGAAGGFTTTATRPYYWRSNAPYPGVVGNAYQFAVATPASAPTATATWQLADLASGYYDVQVSWYAYYNYATNAPFQIYDGNTLLATVNVDETKQPGGPTAGGVAYQSLGMFAIRSGTLRVVLGNNAAGKYVAADSVRVAVPSVTPGQPATVDDALGTSEGFAITAPTAYPWYSNRGYGGVVGDEYVYTATTNSATPTATATWQQDGLAAGTYDVQVSWYAYYNYATNAPLTIYDGSTELATITVDESQQATGSSVNGVVFQSLGTFTIKSGTLRVVLGNNANGRYVVADAIRIVNVG